VEYGVLRPTADGSGGRLRGIFSELQRVLLQHLPDEVAVEAVFYAKNVRTALRLGQAQGAAILAAAESGVQVYEYTPAEVKQAVVGFGRAEKFQVQEMVRRLLGLAALPEPTDAADALAVAICHIHTTGLKNRLSASSSLA